MDREQALQLIKDTFENPFDKATFNKFIKNLLNFLMKLASFTREIISLMLINNILNL